MKIRQLFDLTGQVALVTGGSRGLGLAMARGLGQMGARVLICARRADELAVASEILCHDGVDVETLVVDLAQDVAGLVDFALQRYEGIDILVNNAGCSWAAAAADYPDAAWRKLMTLNVDVPFMLSREIGRRSMLPRGQGKIINIASIAGLAGNPEAIQTLAYNTSKGALINFTRALATEWGPQGINVNAVCPGFFPSKMSRVLLDEMAPQLIAATPLQRLGTDEDIAGVVAFLASRAARHITGQCLVVDGGMSAVIGAAGMSGGFDRSE